MAQGKELFNKVLQNSKGAGAGLGLLAAAGAGAIGIWSSIFTGPLTARQSLL